MGSLKMAVWTAGLLAAAGIGPAVAPPIQGQTKVVRQVKPARVQVLAGGGSWIGVSVRDVDTDDAAKMKLPAANGVLVEEVNRESPAETAGLKTGDVIVEYDGERVRSTRQFSRLVQETPAGRKVQASVMRDGQRVSINLEPQSFGKGRYFDDFDSLPELARKWAVPPVPPAAPAPPAVPAPPVPPAFRLFDFDDLVGRGSGRLGVSVSDLQSQLADYFGVKDGVLVTSVTADSPAGKAGVKAGDVITTFNGSNVTSPSDLRTRASRLRDGEEFTLEVTRDKKSLTLKGKAEDVTPRRRTVTVL
jgi:serine protease Do